MAAVLRRSCGVVRGRPESLVALRRPWARAYVERGPLVCGDGKSHLLLEKDLATLIMARTSSVTGTRWAILFFGSLFGDRPQLFLPVDFISRHLANISGPLRCSKNELQGHPGTDPQELIIQELRAMPHLN